MASSSAAGGTAVGLLPGRGRRAGDPSLTMATITCLGEPRDGLVGADAVVADDGAWGTLNEVASCEVAFALRAGDPAGPGRREVRGRRPGRRSCGWPHGEAVRAALTQSSPDR
ncbi:hypothetical protein PV392_31340 [Streptomyces sp. ME03-5709C]|nr:hypothetical protein [Streptomyces sp. ME03-5709C]